MGASTDHSTRRVRFDPAKHASSRRMAVGMGHIWFAHTARDDTLRRASGEHHMIPQMGLVQRISII
jgi:hypothetical protein